MKNLSPLKSFVNDTNDRAAYTKHWYVVETRMNHEKKLRDQLTNMGVECFIASQIIERQWKYRKKKIEQLILPMKVFVCIEKRERRALLDMSLIIRFMHERNSPTPLIIPTEQMNPFMKMLKCSSSPVSMDGSKLESGCKVRVIRGSLQGLEGSVISHEGRSKLKIEMNMFGAVCVEIALEDIERL